MATIDSKELIDKIISNKGYYEDDPRVALIVEYENYEGKTTWGVTWIGNRDIYKYLQETQFVNNPRIIWQADYD